MMIFLSAGMTDLSPPAIFVHELDGLVAELVRLLDHGGENHAVADALERSVLLVEADDLDRADFVGLLDGADDGRAVVAPQTYQARRYRDTCTMVSSGVGLGADVVGVIRADVDDFHVGAGQRLLDAAVAVVGVLGVERADEDHDLAAVGQGLLDEVAGLLAGGDVVRADVAGAVARRERRCRA